MLGPTHIGEVARGAGTPKRQQASEALDSARAKAGTVLNFIPAFSYISTEAINCIVIWSNSNMTLNINRYNADMHRYVTICKIYRVKLLLQLPKRV
jgi:hypothetical protein